MHWTEHAIWWQVYPLGFCGAPIRDVDVHPKPRLRKLLGWLDYAVELGASGLLLGPIFASETHGYDTTDPFRIDPRLGGDEDFEALVAACKQRGLRVLLDGVFSHVGARHPDLVHVLGEGPDSARAELFDIDWAAAGGPVPRVFEGHDSLVRLNHASDETGKYVASVMRYWLARGINGWRLDAAYAVPAAFWASVVPRIRKDYPDAWFLGEVIHGDYKEFVADATLDSVTQYELWKGIWSSINDRNLFELDWALARHNDFLSGFVPNTFIGNHDVTRIATTLGSQAAVTALAILLTVGGIPSIYYGDEQGFIGCKEHRLGGDDEIRPSFPDAPDQLAPWGADIFRSYQNLIGLRRRNPWLVRATTERTQLENTRYSYRVVAADRSTHLEVEIRLGDHPCLNIHGADGRLLWEQGR